MCTQLQGNAVSKIRSPQDSESSGANVQCMGRTQCCTAGLQLALVNTEYTFCTNKDGALNVANNLDLFGQTSVFSRVEKASATTATRKPALHR